MFFYQIIIINFLKVSYPNVEGTVQETPGNIIWPGGIWESAYFNTTFIYSELNKYELGIELATVALKVWDEIGLKCNTMVLSKGVRQIRNTGELKM